MSAIQQYVSQLGGTIQYQVAGQSGMWVVYVGTTILPNGSLNWKAAFKSTNNGVAGMAIGAVAGVNADAVATKILNTVR
jgi:hypothetical protein